jgi:Tol biopolymer transport system component
MDKKVFLVLPLVIFLAQACNVSPEQKPVPPSAVIAAADLKVTNLHEAKTQNTLPIALSPDGQWLFASDSERVCVLKVETLMEQYCANWHGGATAANAGWSPDGKHIAFSENIQKYMLDGDIWVMNPEPGKITDMTDDGVTGSALNSQALLDTSPAYSPDSKILIFARTEGQDTRTTSIYRMQNNGAPQKLVTVDDYPLSLYWRMAWSGDGRKIFYTLVGPKLDAPQNGVWVVDSYGQNPQHLLGVSQTLGIPILLAVTPKADKALILYVENWIPGKNSLILLDLNTGMSEAVILAKPQNGEILSPIAAAFSPDGSKILYIYNSSNGKQQVAVRDVSGDHENILFSPEKPFGTQGAGPMELDWASNDTIFASTLPNTGTLFDIGK